MEGKIHYIGQPGTVWAACGSEKKFGSYVQISVEPSKVTCLKCKNTIRFIKADAKG